MAKKRKSSKRQALPSAGFARAEALDSPDVPELTPAVKPRRNYARWRALSLSLVYVVFAVHIIHWKITGTTLAPLELNEVMYTLELGVITAGFLFMCALVLGTLVFGRFFCSWACHIIVLQDLCGWLLRKVGIRHKQIRSRFLLLIPPLTAFYMFIWPQIKRTWQARTFPEFHLRTDADGWASFVTDNFWRNLPDAPIIILTFLVCGFALVYLLGSRTFCTYVCPYGAIFALADRFSPTRIRVDDSCEQCGTCTAVCTSGVRVHEEVKIHGMIVNPACLKDLDCVASCPQGALHYTVSKPALFKSFKSGGRFGLPYQFSIAEELLIGFVFVVTLLSFRQLYGQVPFLLSLALGAIVGFFAVLAVRLFTRSNVVVSKLNLKERGRLTSAGRLSAVLLAILAAFVGHSAFIRYHEFNGFRKASALGSLRGTEIEVSGLARAARSHLLTADRWGLFPSAVLEQGMVSLSSRLERFDEVVRYAARFLKRHPSRYPESAVVRLRLARALAAQGRIGDAAKESLAAIALAPAQHPVYSHLGGVLGELAESDEAVAALREAARLEPDVSGMHQALAWALAIRGDRAAAADALRKAVAAAGKQPALYVELGARLANLGATQDAIATLERAVEFDAGSLTAHYQLGVALLSVPSVDDAIKHLQTAVEIAPDLADARYNLGVAWFMAGDPTASVQHIRESIRLAPDDPVAYGFLATVLRELGNVEGAREAAEQAQRLQTED